MQRTRKKQIVIAILFISGLAWFYGLYEAISLPETISLRNKNPETSAYIERFKDKNPKAKIKFTWVPYNKISPYLKEAVIAAEDDEFFQHIGFNLEAIKKAAAYDWKKKRFARWASTLTMQ